MMLNSTNGYEGVIEGEQGPKLRSGSEEKLSDSSLGSIGSSLLDETKVDPFLNSWDWLQTFLSQLSSH